MEPQICMFGKHYRSGPGGRLSPGSPGAPAAPPFFVLVCCVCFSILPPDGATKRVRGVPKRMAMAMMVTM
eukprot:7354396-Pyramimonas_sp.AAC.1